MKKLIALVLVLVMALSLAACGAKAPADDGVKTYKVGVAIYQYNDNFMTLYRQERNRHMWRKLTLQVPCI